MTFFHWCWGSSIFFSPPFSADITTSFYFFRKCISQDEGASNTCAGGVSQGLRVFHACLLRMRICWTLILLGSQASDFFLSLLTKGKLELHWHVPLGLWRGWARWPVLVFQLSDLWFYNFSSWWCHLGISKFSLSKYKLTFGRQSLTHQKEERLESKSESVDPVSCTLRSELFCCTTPGGTHPIVFSIKGLPWSLALIQYDGNSAPWNWMMLVPYLWFLKNLYFITQISYNLKIETWGSLGYFLSYFPLWNVAKPHHINMCMLGQKCDW